MGTSSHLPGQSGVNRGWAAGVLGGQSLWLEFLSPIPGAGGSWAVGVSEWWEGVPETGWGPARLGKVLPSPDGAATPSSGVLSTTFPFLPEWSAVTSKPLAVGSFSAPGKAPSQPWLLHLSYPTGGPPAPLSVQFQKEGHPPPWLPHVKAE